MKKTKKFHLPDIYFGSALLPIIEIVALITSLLLPWFTTLLNYFGK